MLERLSFLTMADRSYRISIVQKKGLLLKRFLSSLIILNPYLLTYTIAPELAKSETELVLN